MSKTYPTNIRITCKAIQDNVNPLPLLLSLTSDITSAVITREHGTNEEPHIHAFIEARYTEKTIRLKLKKILNTGGNEAFKVSKCSYDPIRSCRYNCKKVPEEATALHIGSRYTLEQLKQEYQEFSSAGKKARIKNNHVSNILDAGLVKTSTPIECTVLVLKYFVQQSMPMNKAMAAQIALTIWLTHHSSDADYREVAKCILSEHLPELFATNYQLEKELDVEIDGTTHIRFGGPEETHKSNIIAARLAVPRLPIPPRKDPDYDYDTDIE